MAEEIQDTEFTLDNEDSTTVQEDVVNESQKKEEQESTEEPEEKKEESEGTSGEGEDSVISNLLSELGVESVDELKNIVPPKELRHLVEYAKKEGADIPFYLKVMQIDVEGLEQGLEPLILQKMFKDNVSREDAKFYFEQKYHQTDDYTEGERRLGKMDMDTASKEAVSWLKEFQQKAKTPDAEAKRLQQEELKTKEIQKELANWSQAKPKIMDELKERKLEISIEGKTVPYNLDLSKANEEIEGYVEYAAKNLGLKYSKENEEVIREFSFNAYFNNHRSEIMNAFAKYIRGLSALEIAQRHDSAMEGIDSGGNSSGDLQNSDWVEM